jgi:hypothetical protein
MTWLTWRQYRFQGALVMAALAVLSVVLILTGRHLVEAYNQCRAFGDCAATHFGTRDNTLQLGLSALLLVVPALVGMFWGAPLVAQELESGTYQLRQGRPARADLRGVGRLDQSRGHLVVQSH